MLVDTDYQAKVEANPAGADESSGQSGTKKAFLVLRTRLDPVGLALGRTQCGGVHHATSISHITARKTEKQAQRLINDIIGKVEYWAPSYRLRLTGLSLIRATFAT